MMSPPQPRLLEGAKDFERRKKIKKTLNNNKKEISQILTKKENDDGASYITHQKGH